MPSAFNAALTAASRAWPAARSRDWRTPPTPSSPCQCRDLLLAQPWRTIKPPPRTRSAWSSSSKRFTDELDASISATDQRIEDLAIEEKNAMDAPSAPQRLAERRVINDHAGRAETRPESNSSWITFVSAAAAD
jgi:hypothetical protein